MTKTGRTFPVSSTLSIILLFLAVTGCETAKNIGFAGMSSTPPPTVDADDQHSNAQELSDNKQQKFENDTDLVIDLEKLAAKRTLFSAIPSPAIPRGTCGMILWTLDDEQPTPIMQYTVGEGATIALGGAIAPLELVETAGSSRFGVAEEQAFVGPGGLTLNVRVSFGLGFDGGQYLERSILVIEDKRGWRNVTPSAGLAGCRRK
ncbi:MAG: hypothetical protein AAF720_05020 [Pseudomonadota bacterium]